MGGPPPSIIVGRITEVGRTEIDDGGIGTQYQGLCEAPNAVFRLVHLVAQ